MAHDTKRKAEDVPTTSMRSAPDRVVEAGTSLESGVLVDPLLVVNPPLSIDPLPDKMVGVSVPVGINEDGTAEIGAGAGLPAAGGQKVSV